MKPPGQQVFGSALFALAVALGFPSSASAQHERTVQAAHEPDSNRNFAEQLQRILGQFRIVDLQRIFDTARPVSCFDLVADAGEWREVAFLNEHREFGDWYRDSFDEVRSDLGVYTFNGACSGQLSTVQVTTRFPVEDSLEAYRTGKIHFRDIHVNVNAPVTARFDDQTGAYRFDLPYLFHVSGGDADPQYALSPRKLTDRYAPKVTNRWECKSIDVPDATYDFSFAARRWFCTIQEAKTKFLLER
jgi:hypothetical protein